jgi:hypothetical protein
LWTIRSYILLLTLFAILFSLYFYSFQVTPNVLESAFIVLARSLDEIEVGLIPFCYDGEKLVLADFEPVGSYFVLLDCYFIHDFYYSFGEVGVTQVTRYGA